MYLKAKVFRHIPMLFDAFATLFEGIALQRSVLVEEQLVVDVPSGEVLAQHLKHLRSLQIFEAKSSGMDENKQADTSQGGLRMKHIYLMLNSLQRYAFLRSPPNFRSIFFWMCKKSKPTLRRGACYR